jgi:hypothetical protein
VPPSCNSPRVAAPHNATIPIFLCSDPDGAITFAITVPPTHGTVSAASEGWQNYTPNAGYAKADAFSYSAQQGTDTVYGTVSIEVAPGTKPACVYRAESVPQATLTPLSLLCATGGDPITNYTLSDTNGSSADGYQTEHGTLSALNNAFGKVSYQSAGGYTGADSFTYSAATDFGTSDPATFDLMVLNPQQGPPGNDGTVVSKARLVVASFLDALTVRRGRAVVLRYVSTTDASVVLQVFRGTRRIATMAGRARLGRNSMRWNGKVGSRAAPIGQYRLVLRATSGDQKVSDGATVRITGHSH